ncbi:MAG: phage tail tape measure protein [Lachnospiraceae bacterium]|nr:phage tail tape measure protein [Lachnospiraceae bacterium]
MKVASDFDSAMSQVAAVSGATGKDLEALRDKAREMGSK